MKRKILIVEDDMLLSETIEEFLRLEGYETDTAVDGQEAVARAYEKRFDIILLDVKLPKKNGFECAKEIREFSNTPIIFITSLNEEKDVENGFLSGGDDYIKKPFSLKELGLRIQAVLRRVYANEEKIKIKDNFEFDIKKGVLYKNSEPLRLKRKVVKLLDLFLRHRGEVLSKERILREIYDYDENPNETSLRTFVNTLRHVLGKDTIQTIKDVGYKFVG